MAERFKAPRGTFDVLPGAAAGPPRGSSEAARGDARGAPATAGSRHPIFEETELFARGVGESTDIVQKQMFTFEDQGGRSLTLRPEATASICRAYLEHGMQKLAQPVKLWTEGPFFRHERPQAGRYRQFTQIDAEAIGSDSPLVDAELILLRERHPRRARGPGRPAAARQPRHAGDARAPTSTSCAAYLRSHEGELSEEVREPDRRQPAARLRRRPRGDPQGDGGGADAARPPRRGRRRALRRGPRAARPRTASPTSSTRPWSAGLDYYTRTVFEFECERLGAQSGIGGGGRYDGLIEQLGGPPTPGCGWAIGVERIALALEARRTAMPSPSATASSSSPRTTSRETGPWRWSRSCAAPGIRADLDLADRAVKGQMKQADRVGRPLRADPLGERQGARCAT